MYPQELLFKLEHPSKIQQIQLLSHEYKVGRGCLCRIGRCSWLQTLSKGLGMQEVAWASG